MTQQPPDDLVEQLCMFTENAVSREEAVRRLKAHNSNLEAAINEYFDDPSSKKYQWEESVWTSERDGAAKNAGISFNVQGPDQMDQGGWGGHYSAAPSRPPSRTSNNSPYGPVTYLGAEAAAADPRTKLTQDEVGDHDLQRALALSAEESGTQQMGVIDESMSFGQTFGPANRPSYDTNEWAMVPRGEAFAQEVLPDPDASDRKRREGEPAFLKPSVKETRLASILTIYHEIPLAREVLMNLDNVATDYGNDPEWWTGKKIESSSPNWTGEERWDVASGQDVDDFMLEIQRLMAFLTATERAYGSADAIIKMPALTFQNGNVESQFFDAWQDACRRNNQEHLIPLLYTIALQPGDRPAFAEKHFAIFDLGIPTDEEAENDTIYDLADEALWATSPLTMEGSAYLDSLAEVVAFSLKSLPNDNTRVRIPTTWYPDRYLKENREEALKMRQKKTEVKEEMAYLTAKQKKLTYFRLPSGKQVKVKDLFAASMRHDENLVEPSQQDGEQDHYAYKQSSVNISEELEKVMKSIDLKLQELEQEKEKARASLRELSKLYTDPPTESDSPPTHKYTLRGVAVSKFVTYVRRRGEPNLMSMDEGDLDGVEQWWMLEYSTAGLQHIIVKKVTEDEVLTEAYAESRNCTVVYASEKAMAPRDTRLPESLEKFVQADNLAFRAELGGEQDVWNEHVEHQHVEHQAFESPRSPKRKFDETMGQTDNVPPPPAGPPPAYSPPAEGQFSGCGEKNGLTGLISPPTYSAVYGRNGKETEVIDKQEEPREMLEMQTKGNVPRLMSTMSMDTSVRGGGNDDMDVDDLRDPRVGDGKQ